jgi:RIO-like serine/threonine protein kinase
MSSYQTDIDNIKFHLERYQILQAIDIWLSSYHNISTEKFLKLCDMYGETIEDLLNYLDDKETLIRLAKENLEVYMKDA